MSNLPTTASANGLSPFATANEPENPRSAKATASGPWVIASFWKHLRALVAWRLERRALAELQQLDDRMLRDIGLMRTDIVGGGFGDAAIRSGKPVHDSTTVP